MAFRMVVAGVVLSTSCGKKEEEKAVKPEVAVKVAKAERQDIPLVVNAPATIFAREQASIAARVTAPIRELRVRKGDSVAAGQVLAVLENRDVVAQRQEAQGALVAAQASLQKTVGGTIPGDIERAQGQVATAKAALDQAQKTFERRQSLFQQGAIPQRDLLQTQTDLSTAKTNYDVAVKSLSLLQGTSRESDIKSAQAAVTQAQARVAASSANVQYTELRAPFAGTVTEQLQYPGDMAQPGSPVFTVMDLSNVTARAQVPEADAARVSKGQACVFTSPDSSDLSVQGRVTVVNRAVDSQRRTVEVWCEVSKPPAAIRGGMFGNVAFQTGQVQGAVVVPATGVQLEEGTHHGVAYIVDAKRLAHKREVDTGIARDGQIEVKKGIQAGEMVVTEGAYELPDNTQVTLPGDKKEEKDEKKEKE